MVSTKPSHTEQVQLAAVSPPARMSANTAALQLEMISPSKTMRSSCSRVMAAPVIVSTRTIADFRRAAAIVRPFRLASAAPLTFFPAGQRAWAPYALFA